MLSTAKYACSVIKVAASATDTDYFVQGRQTFQISVPIRLDGGFKVIAVFVPTFNIEANTQIGSTHSAIATYLYVCRGLTSLISPLNFKVIANRITVEWH